MIQSYFIPSTPRMYLVVVAIYFISVDFLVLHVVDQKTVSQSVSCEASEQGTDGRTDEYLRETASQVSLARDRYSVSQQTARSGIGTYSYAHTNYRLKEFKTLFSYSSICLSVCLSVCSQRRQRTHIFICRPLLAYFCFWIVAYRVFLCAYSYDMYLLTNKMAVMFIWYVVDFHMIPRGTLEDLL